ncbi:MAG TPA: hypothetical protein VKQ08_02315 [Cyclobacteriaceae bacterium]|nr:hypothetical protein [Cyclobacteriaceae bacterium]
MEPGPTTLEVMMLAFGVALTMALLLAAGVLGLKWIMKSWIRKRQVARRS